MAGTIVAAAAAVRRGEHDDQFPVDVFQTGSGTSTNMNVNEVIASLASSQLGRRVHPNDEVNASQSSNDVIPTAIRLAALDGVERQLVPALEHLATSLRGARGTVRRRGEGRQDPSDGCRTRDPRTGVRWLRDGGRAGCRAAPGNRTPSGRPAAGWHGGGHGAQRAPGVRTGVHRCARGGAGTGAARDRGPLRGPGRPGRAGGAQRHVPRRRRQPEQAGDGPALDVIGALGGARRDSPAGPATRQLDHAGQGQPGAARGGAPGRRAGRRQRRHDRDGRCVGQRSS